MNEGEGEGEGEREREKRGELLTNKREKKEKISSVGFNLINGR